MDQQAVNQKKGCPTGSTEGFIHPTSLQGHFLLLNNMISLNLEKVLRDRAPGRPWQSGELGQQEHNEVQQKKMQGPNLEEEQPMHWCTLGQTAWEATFQRRFWKWWWTKWSWASKVLLQQRRPAASWDALRAVSAGQESWSFGSAEHQWEHIWSAVPSPTFPNTEGHGCTRVRAVKACKND